MLFGHVRDYSARLRLSLPGQNGEYAVEFVIDTGFNGELALPPSLIRHSDVKTFSSQLIQLADGTEQNCPRCEIMLDWNETLRITEVLVLDGNPLIGMRLLDDCLICFHVSDGGEVTVEEA